MYGIHRLVACVVFVVLLPSCGGTEQREAVAEKKTGLFVINVLDKAWYDDCHIKGSISVPLDKLDEFVKKLDAEKSEIVVYCSNYFCTSSGYAAKRLKDMGFKRVWAYEGGTAEWYQLGLPVGGPSKNAYLARKIEPLAHDADDAALLISVQELAQKLKI